jgi:predicted nucleotidyltransferase
MKPNRPEAIDTRVRQVVEDLKGFTPLRIILFGSAARGDADQFSDLDFVVIKQTHQPFLERLKEAALLVKAPGSIDILVYTPEEWQRMQETESPFAERVLAEGRLVYEAQS